MMFKILAIVSLLSIAGAGYGGYISGSNAVRALMADAVEAERRTQAQKIESHIALKQATKVIYRDRIKTINRTVSTCSKSIAPAAVLDSVR